jgi:hypothetical protein
VLVAGETEYMRRARAEALDWIRHNPAQFLRLSALRLAHFWCGSLHRPLTVAGTSLLTILSLLGLWRLWPGLSGPQRAALGIPLVTFPLVYYLVSYMPRYRVPIDWILLILAGAAILGPSFPKPRRDASR